MKRFLYDTLFSCFALVCFPSFSKRITQDPQPQKLWRERLGHWDGKKNFEHSSIWIHAVSVGEILAAETLVKKMTAEMPGSYFVITTVTPTGQQLARKFESERTRVVYLPFDWTVSVKRFFENAKPSCLILMETEIWPNLLWEAFERNVPVVIANARLSKRSFSRYRFFKGFFGQFFKNITLILAQTEADAQRFRELGAKEVLVAGNLKFDTAGFMPKDQMDIRELKAKLGFFANDRILMAGSTHANEEEMLLPVYGNLKNQFPSLKFFIAPRHVERAVEIKKWAEALGFRAALSNEDNALGSFDVLILNEMGILKQLYSLAEIVFMGGSFIPHGGQNPMEPAIWAKPIFFGPNVFNFEVVYQVFELSGGAFRVQTARELEEKCELFLSDAKKTSEAGKNALGVISSHMGATEKHFQIMKKKEIFPGEPVAAPSFLSSSKTCC